MIKTIWGYTKTRWLLVIVLCLLCWTSVNAPNPNAVKSDDKVIYALFEGGFTEPIEILYFLMNDMTLYRLTSNEENRVSFRMGELEENFKQCGFEISDIIIIIHNHTKDAYFSDSDINMYRTFKSNGFVGKFYLYVWRNKSIYELAENLR